MLELKNITKVYGKKAALQDVSVAFAPGQIVGLFGENGAGKTTLMKCILGLIGHKGEVTLDGEAIGCAQHRAAQLCHLRAQLLPRLSRQGAPGVLSGAFPPGSTIKRFEALMDFFEPAHGQARCGASSRGYAEPVRGSCWPCRRGRTTSSWMSLSPATTSSTGRTFTRCCWASCTEPARR